MKICKLFVKYDVVLKRMVDSFYLILQATSNVRRVMNESAKDSAADQVTSPIQCLVETSGTHQPYKT